MRTDEPFDHSKHCLDRAMDAAKVADAYKRAEEALKDVGKLLRTTSVSGYFGWVSQHKAAATGLRIAIEKLRESVPKYRPE